MTTVVVGDFEWDADKAATNLAKHGVSFEEAVVAMQDPHAIIVRASTSNEDRIATIGAARDVVFIVHVERGPRTRVISARPASRRERARYRAG